MRSTITLNGKESTEIAGLLIQSLPSISKPLMRTQIEEIDGRDGDIVTNLGFSSYQKDITIGLHGDFDINEVIAYFNSEGIVTFSNEPDKYYYYQIINQIDFERLIRFRTATVSFHVQPFKYSTTETEVTLGSDPATIISGEGNDFVLENTPEAPFTTLTAKGDTDQTTYSGKNLLNPFATHNEGWQITSNGVTYTLQQDGINMSGTATAKSYAITIGTSWDGTQIFIPLDKTKTYTLSANRPSNYYRFFVRGLRNGTAVTLAAENNATFTDCEGITLVQLEVNSGLTVQGNICLQLEEGSTATAYEPYVGGTASPNPDYPQDIKVVTGEQTITITDDDEQSQEYTISLGNTELCKIGSYQDYIYKDGDDWYLHKEVVKYVIDENSNIDLSGVLTDVVRFQVYTGLPCKDLNLLMLCDRFQVQSGWNQNREQIYTGYTPNTRLFVFVAKSRGVTDLASFKTWLVSNNITCYLVYNTPVNTKITDSSLISQLDALSNAHSYKGRTHITATATGTNLPYIIEAATTGNMDGTVTNSGNTTARPKLTLYGTGNIGIYLNGVQLFQIALGTEGYITIDTNAMEAYKDTTNNLKNRLVTGDYSNFVLQAGENQIGFSGNATMCVVENYSRWL